MGREERIAFVNAQAVCALAEIEGMKAENAHREACGESVAYGYDAFMEVQRSYLISHNAVIEYLRD